MEYNSPSDRVPNALATPYGGVNVSVTPYWGANVSVTPYRGANASVTPYQGANVSVTPKQGAISGAQRGAVTCCEPNRTYCNYGGPG